MIQLTERAAHEVRRIVSEQKLPEATALRVVSQGQRHAVLELTTGGFYALPQQDGTVLLSVPGFDTRTVEPVRFVPLLPGTIR